MALSLEQTSLSLSHIRCKVSFLNKKKVKIILHITKNWSEVYLLIHHILVETVVENEITGSEIRPLSPMLFLPRLLWTRLRFLICKIDLVCP